MPLNLRRFCRSLSRWLLVAVLALPALGTGTARADTTWTQTSQADFESGTLVQLDTSSSPGEVKLGIAGSRYLYALRGNDSTSFYRYDQTTNTWSSLANTPGNVRWGGALAYDGGNYIYAFCGSDTNTFWRYSVSGNNWTAMAGAPGTVKEGGALTYNNGYVYALRGNNTRDFWRYDVSGNSWQTLANTVDLVKYGGALTDDGGNYVYAFQCDDTQAFYRYDIAANTWTLMDNVPAVVGYGAALTYDGGNYIYALRGGNTRDFWRYDISLDSWGVLTSTPSYLSGVEWGGALAYAGGSYIYALHGVNTKDFLRHDITTNSWAIRASTPGRVWEGGALVRGADTYYLSGNLTSSTYDTGCAADFGDIAWTASVPASTTIKFQIATNNDAATWNFKGPDGSTGTYYTSSGTSIYSGHDGDRYMKYKAYLSTSDTAVTPALADVSITYRQQVILPTATTDEAASVEETTATLHGAVADDGGEACQYRFQYGTSSGSYSDDTGWMGSVTTGQPFSADVTGLSQGTKYYFQAQVKNSAGIGSGAELNFLTKPEAPVDGTFTATVASSTQIDLSWTKGDGAYRTMVRRNTGDFPADRDDGTEVYFDTGTSVSDTGLEPETIYYYRAWSEVTGSQQWSDGYRDVTATTSAAPPPPPPPIVVGGTVYRVDKMGVLAPWIGLFLGSIIVLSLAVAKFLLSRRP